MLCCDIQFSRHLPLGSISQLAGEVARIGMPDPVPHYDPRIKLEQRLPLALRQLVDNPPPRRVGQRAENAAAVLIRIRHEAALCNIIVAFGRALLI